MKKTNLESKLMGKIYTPDYLVKQILDLSNYKINNINSKHVIDNSCGDGQFLVQIVDRYCTDFKRKSKNYKKLIRELETYIHGIEINKQELQECINRCNSVVKHHGINSKINWDFICSDALLVEKFNKKMDFVLGNPPYVRVHNLENSFEKVKEYSFSKVGMTDLFITFYEISLKMLNDNGVIGYITPSSFFTSVAGREMRQYFSKEQILRKVCDLKHFQPFNATAYTAIICLDKTWKNDSIDYYEYDDENICPKYIGRLSKTDYLIDNKYYFGEKNDLSKLQKILSNTKKTNIEVKNGFATLADDIFIGNFNFKSEFLIPVLKGSRAVWKQIIYPYDKDGKLIDPTKLLNDKNIKKYLDSFKDFLVKKNGKEFWYAFGRSQAIHDTFKNKIAINTLIKKPNNLKIIDIPSGSGVYSGLYILPNNFNTQKIKDALKSEEFASYVSLLGKYKSGGFYTFSTSDVKKYIDFKLGE